MWRGGHTWGRLIAATGLVVLAACADPSGGADPPTNSDDAGATSTPTSSPASPPTSTAETGDCDIPAGQAFQEGESVPVEEIGEAGGATVSAALYPHPDYEGDPWSQWGQGYAAPDGRFFSAIGDHLGVDGNSYLYEYDPEARQLLPIGDVLAYVDHVPGTFGYGKVHSQMVPGPCGELYFSTYWGTYRGMAFEGNYTGDLIFRLDPLGRAMAALDVPVEFHGQASLGSHPGSGLIYGEAIDPILKNEDIDRGPFFAYDVVAEETVFVGPEEPHVGYRSVMVDAEGRAYYAIGGAELAVYDPATGEHGTHDSTLPGDWLRAVTDPAPDG